MAGGSGAMRWLARQWHRVQLARELLEQYEYEEAHRVNWQEAMRRLVESGHVGVRTRKSGVAEWRKAIEARADRYPSG